MLGSSEMKLLPTLTFLGTVTVAVLLLWLPLFVVWTILG